MEVRRRGKKIARASGEQVQQLAHKKNLQQKRSRIKINKKMLNCYKAATAAVLNTTKNLFAITINIINSAFSY